MIVSTVLGILSLLATPALSFLTPGCGHCDGQLSRFYRPHSSQLQAESSSSLPDKVLVIGGSSGIGQLVTEKLAAAGTDVCVTTRNIQKAKEIFTSSPKVEFRELDLLSLKEDSLDAALNGVSAVVISVGTTAFPTIKWKGGNTPKAIDDEAVSKIAKVLSKQDGVEKIVIVTSVGIDRTREMPFLVLNLFGVLDAKKAGEEAIKACGKSYCIVRPGRLVGGPFTNLDVAKLLQIQGGAENGVDVEAGDSLLGDCKRDVCAECILQCLKNPSASNIDFSIVSNEKQALFDNQWEEIFQRLAK